MHPIPRRAAPALALAILSASLQARAADAPAILPQIPGDAGAVLIIPNVRALSTKTSNLGVRLGLALPPDIVGFLLRNVGVAKGFDQTGSAAAMYLKANAGTPDTEELPSLVLVPTTDAAALLSTFSPGTADGAGIMEITLAQDTAEKAYAAIVADKWVAVSELKSTLSSYLKRTGPGLDKAMPADILNLFATNDVVGWVNAAGIGPRLLKGIENTEEDTTGRLDLANMTADRDPVSSAFEKEGLVLAFAAIKSALRDAQTGALTVRLTDNGAAVGFTGLFTPGTDTARLVSAQKGLTVPNLAGLPAGNFLVAGAAAWNGPAAADLFQKATAQVFADQILAQDAKAAGLKKVADVYRQILTLSAGARFVLLDASAGPRGGILNGALLLDAADPEKVNALHIQAFQESGSNGGLSLSTDILTTVTVTVDAVTVKDIKLSRVHIAYKLRDEAAGKPVPEDARAALAVINKLAGADGLTLYTGVAGKQVLTILGSDPATLEAAVTAAQDPADKLAANPTLSAVKAEIPAAAQSVLYFSSERLVTVLQNVFGSGPPDGRSPGQRGGQGGGRGPGGRGRGRGAGAPPPAGPALALTISSSGNSARVEAYIPLATLRIAVQAVGGGGE